MYGDGNRDGGQADVAGGVSGQDPVPIGSQARRGGIAKGRCERRGLVEASPRGCVCGAWVSWRELSTFDKVAGEVGFCVGLPGEIDGRAIDYGFKAGGSCWGRGIANGDDERGGDRATQNQEFAVERHGAGSPGDVAVGRVAVAGQIEGSAGVGALEGALEANGYRGSRSFPGEGCSGAGLCDGGRLRREGCRSKGRAIEDDGGRGRDLRLPKDAVSAGRGGRA